MASLNNVTTNDNDRVETELGHYPLGQRAATNVAGANEQYGFHPAQRFKVNP
jgi:hypothetical protein